MSKDKEKANGTERKGTAVEERASGHSGVLQAPAGQSMPAPASATPPLPLLGFGPYYPCLCSPLFLYSATPLSSADGRPDY